MDYLLADVCRRYHLLLGDEVRLQAGTDEHGSKIAAKAKELNLDPQTYVDENAKKFQDFIKKLEVEYTDFVRTTDEDHVKNVQKVWMKLKPHIYLDSYEGWYCTGCESFITQKEYDENGGICPDHNKPYEKLSEKNYYYRIADFKDQIRDAIESGEMKILPEFRKTEILRLLEDTPDVSISRPKAQLEWGIPVPDDDSQVMYVWLDALGNYITVLGYPEKDVSDWWPATAQFVGKDILRFHTILWPALLLGLGLPLPKTVASHGMVLSSGQKMSKSIGNVIDPVDIINIHGVEAFRYYFLRHIDTFADSDFTLDKFEAAYSGELANDLGNLVQRLATLCSKNHFIPGVGIKNANETYEIPKNENPKNIEPEIVREQENESENRSTRTQVLPKPYRELMDNFEFREAFDFVWEKVQDLNRRIDQTRPWELARNGETELLAHTLESLTSDLRASASLLVPFLPATSEKILDVFQAGSAVSVPETPLFPKM